jgi:hypothetical protein
LTEPVEEPTVEETGAQGAGEPTSGGRPPDDPASAAVAEEPPADRSEQIDDPRT